MRAELKAVIKKELRQTFRDRRMVFLLVLAPILQLTLLGYAVDLDVREIPTAVHDLDHTRTSRELIAGLFADGTLRQAGAVDDPGLAMASGAVQAVVSLPRGLERDLLAGRPAKVQLLVDGTDPVRAQVTTALGLQFLQRRGFALARARLAESAALLGRAPSVPLLTLEPRIYYNPRLKSTQYMVPGVAAVTLLVVTTVITAMGLAREREMGTIEQLLITPMRPVTLLLGKTLPFALIGLVTGGLVLAVGTNLFAVPVRGSLLAIFLGMVLYLMSTLGTGIFISTVARTQQQAILGGFFFLLPAILLSGFVTPIENMPGWIQPVTWLNPVRYFVEILRSGLLKGAGVVDLLPQLGALLLFGASILTLSAFRFRKQLA
jgi:ABC-2 type transport system permease protein